MFWHFPIGEGLKIGTLALLRNKHRVVVATHNCSWNFSLERHPHFEETVLTVSLEGLDIYNYCVFLHLFNP